MIAAHYLKGWFWVDLLSSLPLDDISGRHQLRGFRLLRLLRLQKLARYVPLPLRACVRACTHASTSSLSAGTRS